MQEIADEIGVTKQAVYKRYRGKLHEAVSPYARLVAGTTYIMEQGENMIKQDFLGTGAYVEPHTNRLQDTLVVMLQKELTAKNRHIEELANIIQVQTKTIKTLSKPKPQKRKTQVKQGKMSAPIERLINQKQKTCSLPKQHRKARKPR